MREITFQNWVVGVVGRAFNAFVEKGIQIAFVKFEYYAKEGFESITRRLESFYLTIPSMKQGIFILRQ